ncbi:hypothetical protein O181_016098 [Austropuccinia psidii MF-1]|uniref:Uncharacterized protein n=1 Tax=Austropuccinia psidii MF-1 TaxID=1389203 RepID=A0A9Q3C4H2_9BASI|nr:hypothetical protein [Austropuccinia psidii MF-1]
MSPVPRSRRAQDGSNQFHIQFTFKLLLNNKSQFTIFNTFFTTQFASRLVDHNFSISFTFFLTGFLSYALLAMFNRLRSSSFGVLREISSHRSNNSESHENLNQATSSLNQHQKNFKKKSPIFLSPLTSGYHSSKINPALEGSKKELSEVIELLQQVRPNDLSQPTALLSLMVAILSETPDCKECMRENAGFLTLITILASLDPPHLTPKPSSPTPLRSFSTPLTIANSKQTNLYSPTESSSYKNIQTNSVNHQSSVQESFIKQEERDNIVILIFKCLSLALTNDRENQRFFFAHVGYKLVLDALRLSNILPSLIDQQSASHMTHAYRHRSIEKLFGLVFSLIVSDFSCMSLFSEITQLVNQSCIDRPSLQNSSTVDLKAPSLTSNHQTSVDSSSNGSSLASNNLNYDAKFQKISELIYCRICGGVAFRVEVADAVLLFLSLHADLFLSSARKPDDLQIDYELYFMSLKALEVLATASKYNQICLNSIRLAAVLIERFAPFTSHSHSNPTLKGNSTDLDHKDSLTVSAGLEPWPLLELGFEKNHSHLGQRKCRQVMKSIIKQMLQVGCSSREASMLFRQVILSSETTRNDLESLDEEHLEMILSGMQNSSCPPFIHFGSCKDIGAYATLESLGSHPFPPVQSNGWTFACWIQIESFATDKNVFLELLTISDPSQDCFVSIKISNSCRIIVQTNKNSFAQSSTPARGGDVTESDEYPRISLEGRSKKSIGSGTTISDLNTIIEFKGFTFELNTFYHLAVVQRAGTKTTSPNMSLFINGECMNTLEIAWPVIPKSQPVSAYFGSLPTPNNQLVSDQQDQINATESESLRARLSTISNPYILKHSRLRWNLSGSWLFNQSLSDNMLFVMSTLGPKIFTCFQDALGSFQTYTSSTLLNLKIDQLYHQAAQEPKFDLASAGTAASLRRSLSHNVSKPVNALHDSPLVKAIKEPASNFISQHMLYFAFSAKNGLVLPSSQVCEEQHSSPSCVSSSTEYSTDCLNHPHKTYTLIDLPSSCHQPSNKTLLASRPTSSVFGPSFANGILNAALPNSKASHCSFDDPSAFVRASTPPSFLTSKSSPLIASTGICSSQVLKLAGNVTLCSPKGLDDAAWKTCGSIFLIRLISLSATETQLMMTLEIFFQAIYHNWRLSEDAEKIQAYESIALILRSKTQLITPSVHQVLLRSAGITIDGPSSRSSTSQKLNCLPSTKTFVSSSPVLSDHGSGPGSSKPFTDNGLKESVITNPLAFRFLLLDFDLWSSTRPEVQLKHFQSLCGMIENSVWSHFVMKRISKLNLLPKMLHALRIRQFTIGTENVAATTDSSKVFSLFIYFLGFVLKTQFTSQSIRHLASYLTASLTPHRQRLSSPSSPLSQEDRQNHVLPLGATNPNSDPTIATNLVVPTIYVKPLLTSVTLDEPIMVLKVFHDLLLSSNDQESSYYIDRFLKAINGSKWLLMFFRKDAHLDVITYSLRVLTRLAQTQHKAWLQSFKNTLAGFTLLRSVLTRFCFNNESILVATLSMLSQADIRQVPIFTNSSMAPSHGCTPLVSKEELYTIIMSIQGAPNEFITPEILPVLFGLLKPAYIVQSSEKNMIPVYVMEWLTSRMQTPDNGWNKILGDSDMLKVWANYVTLLNCLPYQEGLYPHNEPTESESINQSATQSPCLSSFPLRVAYRPSNMSSQTIPFRSGVSTNFVNHPAFVYASTTQNEQSFAATPKPMLTRRRSQFALKATGLGNSLRINIPQMILVEGRPVSLATPPSSGGSWQRGLNDYFEDLDASPITLSLYAYDDAPEDIIQKIAKLSQTFLISFLFDQVSTLGTSKICDGKSVQITNNILRLSRIDQLLSLVIDRTEDDRAWITPLIHKMVEVIVFKTDITLAPLEWLIPMLMDGYLSGWLQPNPLSVSQLISFGLNKKTNELVSQLIDLLLIVLTNRYTLEPEKLLEELRSPHLAELIAMAPPVSVLRMVYILTQYLSEDANLSVLACDALKLIFSYHPLILEGFFLDNVSSQLAIDHVASTSSSLDRRHLSIVNNDSMSEAERGLAQLLQMQPDTLKRALEKSPSINLAGKLDWVQLVNELEVKASRIKAEHWAKSHAIWNEYKNKSTIENRRLDNVMKKMESWARSVKEIDTARLANLRQDNIDNKHYVESQLSKRFRELYLLSSVLDKKLDNPITSWALDYTEGPSRQRRKLRRLPVKLDTSRPQKPKVRHHRMRSLGTSRRDSYEGHVPAHGDPKQNECHSPTSPTGYESAMQRDDIWKAEIEEDENCIEPKAAAEQQGRPVDKKQFHKVKQDEPLSQVHDKEVSLEDLGEDKSRRILKSLEVGDVIQAVWNVEQVVGLDTCPALFLLAKNNVYIIDGFLQKPSGELVNSWDAWEERDPHLLTLASLSRQTAKLNSRAAAHQTRRWAYSDIISISSRKWLFRDICIELLFSDGRGRLLTFSHNKRDEALKRLKEYIRTSVGSEILTNMNVSLKSQTELWQNGELSNHAYLLYLNDIAGRTYRDLTQYLVFPWILADYTSSHLDLEKPESFRKLALPMGAQTESRKCDFIERFNSLEEFGVIGNERMKPAHYMTHYSSAVVVCGFLIRLKPFCDHFVEIQGSFDHADRTFWSIHRAWLSASQQSRSDVRELTPEFFHCPEFLLNLNKLSLGSRQEGGDPIGDVQLPPWAHGDPQLFVELHREALESDFVSKNIHHWIDLIFGYKQRGQAALDAVNLFQEVSYEGSVSLDAIDDDHERSSVLGAMCNWGLTPSQIFHTPHPARNKLAKYPFEAKSTITAFTCSALIQLVLPIRETHKPISQIYPAQILEKTVVSEPQSLLVPPASARRLEWGFLDHTFRIFDSSNALCGTFEGVSSEHISSACFADQRTLVTGSTDSTISLWKFAWLPNGGAHVQQVEVLRGHSAPITCISASRTLSIVVSGAEDGQVMIWDLNRALLVHSLRHLAPVLLVAISESTGDLATCSQNGIKVWSINGALLSTLLTSQYTTEAITSCCWTKAEVKPLLITGHRGGKIMFWQRKSVHASNSSKPWKMELIHSAQHVILHGQKIMSEISAIAITNKTLFTGDRFGRLFCWTLPNSTSSLPDLISSNCMLCDKKFGILESKRKCNGCSAVICLNCQDNTTISNGRSFCLSCLSKLTKFIERK